MNLRGVFRLSKLPSGQRAMGTKKQGGFSKLSARLMEVLKNTKQDLLQKVLVRVKVLITLKHLHLWSNMYHFDLRLLLALASFFGWPVDQLDVVTAFLYGLINESVGLHQSARRNGH
jgi:prepilin signal peptidase PulO-like enzyme (type II secretory pathway)